MKTKRERFKDERKDRLACCYSHEREAIRDNFKKLSKQFAPLFKDVRLDRRFAAPALLTAIRASGWHGGVPGLAAHVAAMGAHRFADSRFIDYDLLITTGAHVSTVDQTKIAFFPTRADALRNRVIVSAPGRFYAAAMPHKTPDEIKALADAYTMAHAPVQVFYGKGEDDFARIYSNFHSFSSCMGNSDTVSWGWDADYEFHPVRAYGHPDNDLELAWISSNGRADGKTVGRAIVNRKHMTHSRIYGDERLKAALRAEGFSDDWNRTMRGQKCLAILKRGELVAPYMDGDYTCADWDGRADFFTISNRGIHCQNTNGLSDGYEDNTRECDDCGERVDEEETHYSEHHETTICSCCRDNYVVAYTGRNCQDLVREDEAVELNCIYYLNDETVLSLHNIVEDEDGDFQHIDDCIYLEYRSAFVLADDCTKLDVAFDGDDYARDCDVKTVTIDGEQKTVHEDFEMEETA